MKRKIYIYGLHLFFASLAIISSSMSCRREHLVRNATKDTLLLLLTTSDTFEKTSIYWARNQVDPTSDLYLLDTTVIYVHGKKIPINNQSIIPSRTIYRYFGELAKDSCYIYAIKWSDATRYTPDEIRKNKLYDRRIVSKKELERCLYEYRYE